MRNLLPVFIIFLLWSFSSLFFYQQFFIHSQNETLLASLTASREAGISTNDPIENDAPIKQEDIKHLDLNQDLVSESVSASGNTILQPIDFPINAIQSETEQGAWSWTESAEIVLDDLANRLIENPRLDLTIQSRFLIPASDQDLELESSAPYPGNQPGLKRANALRTAFFHRGIPPSRLNIILEPVSKKELDRDGFFSLSFSEAGELADLEIRSFSADSRFDQNPETDKMLILTRHLGFAYGSSTLPEDPETQTFFNQLAKYLNRYDQKSVYICGHTCDISSAGFNQRLGEARASAVEDQLLSMGIDAGRIRHGSAGENFPIAENSSKEGQQANRRVEIIIR
jgi:outer membrane protein OmpA-like peptidoglycan-associated protein